MKRYWNLTFCKYRDPTSNYNVGNIVQYKQQLWRAVNQIEGAVAQDLFSTFDSSAFYKENVGFSTTNLLLLRNARLVSVISNSPLSDGF